MFFLPDAANALVSIKMPPTMMVDGAGLQTSNYIRLGACVTSLTGDPYLCALFQSMCGFFLGDGFFGSFFFWWEVWSFLKPPVLFVGC